VRRIASLLILFALIAPRISWSAASAWSENEQSRVRLITPWQVAPRSGELRMGLHFKLSPGWHVYWKNSGDAGFPPVLVFRKAPGLGEPELLWPAPHRFELPGDLVAFGYEDEVVYPIQAALKDGGDRLRLEADLDYLVCEVDCIPYRYTLALDQPLGSPVSDPDTAPLIERWWSRLPAGQIAGVSTEAALEGNTLEVRVRGARPGGPGDDAQVFLESHEAFDTGKPIAQATDDGVVYRVPLKPREVGKMPSTTKIAWTVTGLSPLDGKGQPFSLEASRQVGPKPVKPASLLESPVVLGVLAAAFTLLALGLWGLLGASIPAPSVQALGFAAGAAALGLLYALSRQIRPERLAIVELALLAMALLAWLRHRNQIQRRTR
jgi:suppressor for copper-sensitivity B